MKKTVAVIFGGYSPEYGVSLVSAYSIINAINRDKYDVFMIGISREGKWYSFTGDTEDIRSDKWISDERCLRRAIISPSRGEGILECENGCARLRPVDVVFPVLHGKHGEDGTVQGLCELAGIPVVGSGSASSALCMDKDRAHRLVSLHGIRHPKSICFEHVPEENALLNAAGKLQLPLFVKPVKAGSSYGISKVEHSSELLKAVETALIYDDAVIIEENVEGFEAGCAVIGNHDLITGRIDEIELAGGFFDYDEKYTLKTSKIHMPARIDKETEQRLQDAAKIIYRALGCRGYARVDMFLTKQREIVFNEVNTIPGFTPFSRFPNMMKGVGVNFEELVDKLIQLSYRGEADDRQYL